jgi:hypothetical protein
MAVIVVRGSSRAGFRRQGALLLFGGLKRKPKDACDDDEYRCNNGYFHWNGSSGCTSIPR